MGILKGTSPDELHTALRDAFEQAYRKQRRRGADDLTSVTVEILDHNRTLEFGAVLDGVQHLTSLPMREPSGLRSAEWMYAAEQMGFAFACGIKYGRTRFRSYHV